VQTNDGKNVLGPNGEVEVEVEKASMKAKFEADELHKLNGGNGLLKCYYCEKGGNSFQTNSEIGYHKHGSSKHPNKSLYPNLATIEKYSLRPQGKDWEV
jgi:hypothetical protein